jgi:hypothetical protein
MGEIADDMINGACCSLCGCYFVDQNGEIYEHGYPVYCHDCYDPDCGTEEAEEGIETL